MKHRTEPEEIKRRMIKTLKEKGYKLTPQRVEIIDLLSKDKTHASAMDVFKKVREKAPRMSVSTVYYTLDILIKEALIRELEFYNTDNRYDVNLSNHLNLICTHCGKIEDFMEALPISAQTVEKKIGFKPFQMRFEYYGNCKECRGKQQL
ncbi:MAG TPA: Fur family transcriptional regulator [Nitrospirota bacterium]|nr:Fur family transcriptional regulator [Nitrospirota bacterium]